MGRVLSIVNQKGGVGKTTTAVNLSAALAERDSRVLLVDMDAQGNATTGLGVNRRQLAQCIYDTLVDGLPISQVIVSTAIQNLSLVPARMDLAAAEIELVPVIARETCLRRALQSVISDYEYIILDAPPSLGILTINTLVAADAVLIPIQCEYYALEGLSQLMRVIGMVQDNLNPNLKIRGVLLTMYDKRTKLSRDVWKEVVDHFGPRAFRTVVPRSIRLSESPSHGQPITVYSPESHGARAYRLLAQEVSADA